MSSEREATDRLPPQSVEAERGVLGSMLRDNGVIGDVMQILATDGHSFYYDHHIKIYQAIVSLHDRGHPVDLVTLAEHLRERQHLEDVGGYVVARVHIPGIESTEHMVIQGDTESVGKVTYLNLSMAGASPALIGRFRGDDDGYTDALGVAMTRAVDRPDQEPKRRAKK